jgi:hypothetical protein
MIDRLSLTNTPADANIDRQNAERIATIVDHAIRNSAGWRLICAVRRCPECAALDDASGSPQCLVTAPFRKHALRWSPIGSAAPADRRPELGGPRSARATT